jgi:hypothetical protein
MSSTRALAVALQTRWPPPLARVPLALRDLVALSCCSRALRVEGLGGLLVLKKMLDHWSAAVLRAKIQEKEDQFEQWLREDTERFLARWRRWNRELEQAEAEEQAELEKQRAMTEGLEETKHHDDLTKYHDDDLIKYHDDDPGHAGLQETKHSTTTTHLTRTVTVRAGSIVQFLDPRDTTKVIKQVRVKKDLQLTVHRKPNDKEEKQEEEVVV